ncbi:MAG TPA: NAD(P)-dependent oxidoreductase [Geminicoccaceae bacterium]|nr:NAD(P)-dependent oxidoreductase [Geminicoccaceae bacterium]
MSSKPRIGYVGVGLMGHGAARNILERGGYPLTIMGHRNREPVEDLVRRGAVEAANAAAVAEASDIVFLCLPSSVEVEAVVHGEGGLLGAMRPGRLLVDSTTADPTVTRRLGADLRGRGAGMIDAALGRTPKEAEAGRLATSVGGEPDDIARVRPILETYADTIVVCGALGAGTTCKLVNNSITIGMCALIAEGFATAAKVGVDLDALAAVLSAGGADGRMWQMMAPWVRDGDDSHLKGPLRIAAKDMRFYNRMAEDAGVATFIAQAVSQTYRLALNRGHAERFMPVLPGILAELNGARIRDLER